MLRLRLLFLAQVCYLLLTPHTHSAQMLQESEVGVNLEGPQPPDGTPVVGAPKPKLKFVPGEFPITTSNTRYYTQVESFVDRLIVLRQDIDNSDDNASRVFRQTGRFENKYLNYLDIYDKKYKLLKTITINPNGKRIFDLDVYKIKEEIHLFYTTQDKESGSTLYREVYNTNGEKIKSEIVDKILPEDNAKRKSLREVVYYDNGLDDFSFYKRYSQDNSKFLLYYEDLTNRNVVFKLKNAQTLEDIWSVSVDLLDILVDANLSNVMICGNNNLFFKITGKKEKKDYFKSVIYFLADMPKKQYTQLNINDVTGKFLVDERMGIDKDGNPYLLGMSKKDANKFRCNTIFVARFEASSGTRFCFKEINMEKHILEKHKNEYFSSFSLPPFFLGLKVLDFESREDGSIVLITQEELDLSPRYPTLVYGRLFVHTISKFGDVVAETIINQRQGVDTQRKIKDALHPGVIVKGDYTIILLNVSNYVLENMGNVDNLRKTNYATSPKGFHLLVTVIDKSGKIINKNTICSYANHPFIVKPDEFHLVSDTNGYRRYQLNSRDYKGPSKGSPKVILELEL